MIIIGLTGSIGMGKSTVAEIFARRGVPTHDADMAAHRLMAPNGKAYRAIACAFPFFEYYYLYSLRRKNGARQLNRKKLGKLVFENPEERKKLEAILHPLVREDQNEFIKAQRRLGRKMVLLDIPLLFETDAINHVDYSITVAAPYHLQRERVLARPNMSEEKFHQILAAQMPSEEKKMRADYVIHTGLGLARTQADVRSVLRDIKQKEQPSAVPQSSWPPVEKAS